MTDANYTHITVLLDESTSMGTLAPETRSGFNSFLEEQKALDGKATMTVCKFSSGYRILSSMRDIKSVEPLTPANYSPNGSTALLDAMGKCITELGTSLKDLSENERPGKVLFLIITDGEENCSREWSKAKIAEMVKHQEEAYKWNFMYLGANVDAFAESRDLGIRASNSMGFTADAACVGSVYGAVSHTLSAVRGSSSKNVSYDLFNVAHVDDLKEDDILARISAADQNNKT